MMPLGRPLAGRALSAAVSAPPPADSAASGLRNPAAEAFATLAAGAVVLGVLWAWTLGAWLTVPPARLPSGGGE